MAKAKIPAVIKNLLVKNVLEGDASFFNWLIENDLEPKEVSYFQLSAAGCLSLDRVFQAKKKSLEAVFHGGELLEIRRDGSPVWSNFEAFPFNDLGDGFNSGLPLITRLSEPIQLNLF